MSALPGAPTAPRLVGVGPGALRLRYTDLLGWALTLTSSVRMLSYLPTLWAIHASADSSQHSLWTWGTWLVSNLTMAAWLYENNGRRGNAAVLVSGGNSAMCLTTVLAITAYRG